MFLNENGFFETHAGKVLNVHASQTNQGRWQFRMGGPDGDLLASGGTPAQFVKKFWMRDDFEG